MSKRHKLITSFGNEFLNKEITNYKYIKTNFI